MVPHFFTFHIYTMTKVIFVNTSLLEVKPETELPLLTQYLEQGYLVHQVIQAPQPGGILAIVLVTKFSGVPLPS